MSDTSRGIGGTAESVEPGLIAASEAMRRVLELARRVAPSNSTVLVSGETGTGKEVFARYTHRHSRRAGGPFVPVNCGAYTDSLLASELFGHVRGAFTGAVVDRQGVFEVAAKGTVFLDEIGTMSPAMQVKILRVLEERQVMRVGSSKPVPVNVRIIAATNSDLAGLVRENRFREDLYYRIKVVACRIPPLRERRDDIQPLIEHFVRTFSDAAVKSPVRLDAEALRLLLEHHWPGNVRQLRGEIEQLVTMAEGGSCVGPPALSEDVRRGTPADEDRPPERGDARPEADNPINVDATYQELLDQWTRVVVRERLERYDGNITKTAQSLAVSRSTLYALLKKYGMHGNEG